MKKEEPDLYLRGGHYLLTCLFNLKRINEFEKVLRIFEKFGIENEKEMKPVSKIIHFLYFSMAKLDHHYLTGNFKEGIACVPEILKNIKKYRHHLDPHRNLVFYYKIANHYFGNEDYKGMIDYVNAIINMEVVGQLREDLQGYVRLIQLIGHYELKNFELLDYLAPSTYRFLEKMKELNEVQKATLTFLKKLIKDRNIGHRELFIEFKQTLRLLSKDPHSKRALLYLDLYPWVEAKIQNKSIRYIIQNSLKTGIEID